MFWDQFIQLCNERDIKPNPLAKELGISSGILTRWKSGSLPNTETLIKISNYFNVSIDFLIYGEKAHVEMQKYDNSILVTDKNECLLIKNYRAVHYAKQIQVLSSVITEAEKNDDSQ